MNLGGDTDSNAAIAGGLAGIYHEDIPINWIEQLRGKEVIDESIDSLLHAL